MLPPEQDGPRNATRVLALQEERLGFAVLEAKDLAVAADVELALISTHELAGFPLSLLACVGARALLLLLGERQRTFWGKAEELEWNRDIPCQGRSADR